MSKRKKAHTLLFCIKNEMERNKTDYEKKLHEMKLQNPIGIGFWLMDAGNLQRLQ